MTMLDYESESNTLMGGLTLTPNDRLKIAFDAVWNEAEAALQSFDFDVPESYLAANPNQSFDYTLSYLASDLDVSRLEIGAEATWAVSERLALAGGYRLIDFDDDAPYLGDLTGQVEFVHLGLRWMP